MKVTGRGVSREPLLGTAATSWPRSPPAPSARGRVPAGPGVSLGWAAGANRGLALLAMEAGPWSAGLEALSRFLTLPAPYHKESIYFSGVAGLPPLTWTLFAAAETVWCVFGSLSSLQIIKHLQHLFIFIFFGVCVRLRCGDCSRNDAERCCRWRGGSPSLRSAVPALEAVSVRHG